MDGFTIARKKGQMMTGKILSDAEINKLRELASNITITECSIKKEFVNQIIGTIDELKRESRDEQLARQEIEKRLKDQCRETNCQAARAEQAEAALGTPEVYAGVVPKQLEKQKDQAVRDAIDWQKRSAKFEQRTEWFKAKCEQMAKVVEAAGSSGHSTDEIRKAAKKAHMAITPNGAIPSWVFKWLHRIADALDGHPTEEACPECGGEKVIDSGGFDPYNQPINVPCPSCTEQPEGEKAGDEVFGHVVIKPITNGYVVQAGKGTESGMGTGATVAEAIAHLLRLSIFGGRNPKTGEIEGDESDKEQAREEVPEGYRIYNSSTYGYCPAIAPMKYVYQNGDIHSFAKLCWTPNWSDAVAACWKHKERQQQARDKPTPSADYQPEPTNGKSDRELTIPAIKAANRIWMIFRERVAENREVAGIVQDALDQVMSPKATKSEDKVLQELRDEASRKQMDAKDPLTEAFWRQVQSWIDKQRNRIVKEADNGLG